MKFELEEIRNNIPDDELIVDIKRVAVKLQQNHLTIDQYNSLGKFSSTTFKRRFGTWSKATKLAGLDQTKSQRKSRISEEELFENLEDVWIRLGRQPRRDEMFEPLSKYSSSVYKRRFGNWMNALRAFVAYAYEEATAAQEINDLISAPAKHKTQREVNWRLRFLVMRRDNFKCQSCGRSPATDPSIILHVDHKKAWANGGETVLDNLQTLCSVCNIGKSNI